jgi:hypothetical protein
MGDRREFSATSQAGDFAEALRAAVAAATTELSAPFFAWTLERVTGTVGGIVNAHDVTVTLSAGPLSILADASQPAKTQCGDWYAWHDRMPGKKPTLHVVGQCVFPTGGYSVELRPASPQGFNPAIYILDKVVHSPNPGDDVTQAVTKVNIHYREETGAVYTDVQIRPENTMIAVQEVS